MQTTYRTHLDALHQWISEINSYLRQNINFIITPSIEANVLNGIQCIANCIDLDYPFYSAQLYCISAQLFIRNQLPRFQPNPALNVMMFSELFVIERHLYQGYYQQLGPCRFPKRENIRENSSLTRIKNP